MGLSLMLAEEAPLRSSSTISTATTASSSSSTSTSSSRSSSSSSSPSVSDALSLSAATCKDAPRSADTRTQPPAQITPLYPPSTDTRCMPPDTAHANRRRRRRPIPPPNLNSRSEEMHTNMQSFFEDDDEGDPGGGRVEHRTWCMRCQEEEEEEEEEEEVWASVWEAYKSLVEAVASGLYGEESRLYATRTVEQRARRLLAEAVLQNEVEEAHEGQRRREQALFAAYLVGELQRGREGPLGARMDGYPPLEVLEDPEGRDPGHEEGQYEGITTTNDYLTSQTLHRTDKSNENDSEKSSNTSESSLSSGPAYPVCVNDRWSEGRFTGKGEDEQEGVKDSTVDEHHNNDTKEGKVKALSRNRDHSGMHRDNSASTSASAISLGDTNGNGDDEAYPQGFWARAASPPPVSAPRPTRVLSSSGSERSRMSPKSADNMSPYSSGSENDIGFTGAGGLMPYDPYGTGEDYVYRQKDRVISIILGNLFTLGIISLVYFNYVLFESYIGVFLYAFLASEALWDTKRGIVDALVFINDHDVVSPRRMLEGFFIRLADKLASKSWVVAPALGVFTSFMLIEPLLCLLAISAVGSAVILVYTLDRRIFYLTKLHRFMLDDSTFVAFLLIILLMVLGVICTTLFAVFAFHDMKMLMQMIHTWAEETLMNSTWAQETWREITGHGEHALDSWLGDFEEQYVTNTTWEPAFRWIVRYMEQSRLSVADTCDATSAMAMATGAAIMAGHSSNSACSFDGSHGMSTLSDMPDPEIDALLSSSADRDSTGAQLKKKKKKNSSTSSSASEIQDSDDQSWYTLPTWMQNKSLPEILQVVVEHTKSTDLRGITDKVQGVVMQARDGFWTSTIFTMSILFLVIDFGIRVMFFITITFILLSSEDNLMHEILTGIFSSDNNQVALDSYNMNGPTTEPVHSSTPTHGATHWSPRQTSHSSTTPAPQTPPVLLHSSSSETCGGESEAFDDLDAQSESANSGITGGLGPSTCAAGPLGAAAQAGAVHQGRIPDIIRLEQQLRATMEAVLMLTLKMSLYRASATFVLYKVMGVQLPYLAALLTIMLTLFPVVYAYWACLPWCLVFAFHGRWQSSLILFTLQYILSYQLDSWALGTFQKKIQQPFAARPHTDQSKNEFMTGMSMFFGVTAFGAHGVILGPLLVCLGIVSYNTLKTTQQSVRGLQNSVSAGNIPPVLSSASLMGGVQRSWSGDTPAPRSVRRRMRSHRRSDSENATSTGSRFSLTGAEPISFQLRSDDLSPQKGVNGRFEVDSDVIAQQNHLGSDDEEDNRATKLNLIPKGTALDGPDKIDSTRDFYRDGSQHFQQSRRRENSTRGMKDDGDISSSSNIHRSASENGGHHRRSSEPPGGVVENCTDEDEAAASFRARPVDDGSFKPRYLAKRRVRLDHAPSSARIQSGGSGSSQMRRHNTASGTGESGPKDPKMGFFDSILGAAINAASGSNARTRHRSGGTLEDMFATRGESSGLHRLNSAYMGSSSSSSRRRPSKSSLEDRLKDVKSLLDKGIISDDHYNKFVNDELATLRSSR